MTIVSTFYDALVTKIAATWTTAHHIADALNVPAAPSVMLADGFSIGIGPAAGLNKDLGCQERMQRDILIIRTRTVTATDSDATKLGTSLKNLLEDHYTIRRALRLDNTLGGVVSDIGFVSDSGVEKVPGDNIGNFHVMTSLFTVTYIEDLT